MAEKGKTKASLKTESKKTEKLRVPWHLFPKNLIQEERVKILAVFSAQPDRVREAFTATMKELTKNIKVSTQITIEEGP